MKIPEPIMGLSINVRNPNKLATTAFRALHRGELKTTDAVADIYGKYANILLYDLELNSPLVDQLYEFLIESYAIEGAIVKTMQKNPIKQGLIGPHKILGAPPPPWFEVCEHDLKFKVTLTQKQHTGLFLDQRDNRKFVLESAKDKSIANLFSFTCSFSVVAAKGGAEIIHSVDVAKSALQWGKENFSLNEISPEKFFFFPDDVRDWLKRQIKKKAIFDMVICDPPTYASGDKQPFHIEREWPFLAEQIRSILSSHGQALFSNNFQQREKNQFYLELTKHFSKVKRLPPPEDFPVIDKSKVFTEYFHCQC